MSYWMCGDGYDPLFWESDEDRLIQAEWEEEEMRHNGYEEVRVGYDECGMPIYVRREIGCRDV